MVLNKDDNSVYSLRGDPIFNIDRLFNLNPVIKTNPQYGDGNKLVVSFITNTTTFNRQQQDDKNSSISTKELSGVASIEQAANNMNIDGNSSDEDMFPSKRQTGVMSSNE